jgi:hypothetical protein
MLKPSGSNYQGGCADSPNAGGIGHRYDAANLKQTAEEIFKRRQVRTTGLTSYFPGDFVLVLIFEGKCSYLRAKLAHLVRHLPP